MEQQSQPKRGRGRPPKVGETKRTFFQTRMRESQRRSLEAVAAENGRSLSEEIELRLELSLRDDQLGAAVFGDAEQYALMAAFGRLVLAVQMRTAKGIEDRDARHQMADSISGFLRDSLEIYPAHVGRPLSAYEIRSLADSAALQALAALEGRPVVIPAAALADAAARASFDAAAAALAEAFVERFPDHPFSRRVRPAEAESPEKPSDEAA